MQDITKLNYKIDEFDIENKKVKITFDDGSWADITLTSPLPTNMEELENQIKVYAPTVEHLQAKIEESDLSFITSNIGIERTCDRRTLNTPIPEAGTSIDNLDQEELYKVQMTIAVQRTLAEMAGATV